MDPEPLSPRAVAEAAEAAEQPTTLDPIEAERWRQQQRRARYEVAAGVGLALSGLAHLAVASGGSFTECGDRQTTMSLLPAGLIAGVGATLIGHGVYTLSRPGTRTQATDSQKAGAVAIALASLAITQAGLWGLWAFGTVAAC